MEPLGTPVINSLKSGLYTALWTFIGTVLLLSVGWLQSLASWSSTNGHAPLPGLSTIGYAVIGALVSAASGLVAFLVRTAQTTIPAVPGAPPQFPTPATPAVPEVAPDFAVNSVVTPPPSAPTGEIDVVAEIQRRKAALDTAQAAWQSVQAAVTPPT